MVIFENGAIFVPNVNSSSLLEKTPCLFGSAYSTCRFSVHNFDYGKFDFSHVHRLLHALKIPNNKRDKYNNRQFLCNFSSHVLWLSSFIKQNFRWTNWLWNRSDSDPLYSFDGHVYLALLSNDKDDWINWLLEIYLPKANRKQRPWIP